MMKINTWPVLLFLLAPLMPRGHGQLGGASVQFGCNTAEYSAVVILQARTARGRI